MRFQDYPTSIIYYGEHYNCMAPIWCIYILYILYIPRYSPKSSTFIPLSPEHSDLNLKLVTRTFRSLTPSRSLSGRQARHGKSRLGSDAKDAEGRPDQRCATGIAPESVACRIFIQHRPCGMTRQSCYIQDSPVAAQHQVRNSETQRLRDSGLRVPPRVINHYSF